jgi:hypothetical protein
MIGLEAVLGHVPRLAADHTEVVVEPALALFFRELTILAEFQ